MSDESACYNSKGALLIQGRLHVSHLMALQSVIWPAFRLKLAPVQVPYVAGR